MVGGMIGWFGGQQLIGTAAVGSQDRWLVGTALGLMVRRLLIKFFTLQNYKNH